MKKCLLIAPTFCGYYKLFISALEKLNYETTFFSDQVQISNLTLIKRKIFKKSKAKEMSKYTEDICLKIKDKDFDVALIILAYDFSCENLKKIRETLPNTRFVYYAWDAVSNFPILNDLANICDEKYSFDNEDCDKYGFKFLPLFNPIVKEYSADKKYDYSGIMNFYGPKADSYRNIKRVLPKNLVGNEHLKLMSHIYYLYSKIAHAKQFKGFKKKDFKYTSLSIEECYEIYSSSKAVIDTPLARQVGLTIRTFECLGLHTKLITTNKNIKNYDFYTPNNIIVVDESTKEIPNEFFNTPFDENYKLGDKYSVENFVKTLIYEEDIYRTDLK